VIALADKVRMASSSVHITVL